MRIFLVYFLCLTSAYSYNKQKSNNMYVGLSAVLGHQLNWQKTIDCDHSTSGRSDFRIPNRR